MALSNVMDVGARPDESIWAGLGLAFPVDPSGRSTFSRLQLRLEHRRISLIPLVEKGVTRCIPLLLSLLAVLLLAACSGAGDHYPAAAGGAAEFHPDDGSLPLVSELDSLADVISFGAAPAVMAFAWGLKGLGQVGWAAGFIFLSAAAMRLARFNIQTHGQVDKRYFVGMPTPAAANP